jgi:hypothetical protein
MPLDESIMDLYPDDGFLPDIADGVIEDAELNVTKTFSEETAGISEHPAEMLHVDDVILPIIFLEKISVSDPEGVRLAGRTFTSPCTKKTYCHCQRKCQTWRSVNHHLQCQNTTILICFPVCFPPYSHWALLGLMILIASQRCLSKLK